MLFFCKYCTYSSNRSYNVYVHEGRKHKKNEQTNEAQQEYMIKTFAKTMEMIEKYELDVQKMSEEVKDAIRFNLKMVVKD